MGKFTISFDFELGWGAIETGLWAKREKQGVYEGMRPCIKRLTALLDQLNASLTWATVGAMISDPSESDFDYLPDTYSSSAKNFLKTAKESTRNGRDLLETLLSMHTPQDIGSHSFSHTRFLVNDYTEAAKRKEMEKSVTALKAYGVTPKSFVFPVNQTANLDIIQQSGLKVARIPPQSPKTTPGKLWERINGRVPSANRKNINDDFYTENGTMLYHWHGTGNWKARRALVHHQAQLGLRKASNSDYHFHLWLHPFNLVEIPYLESDLSDLLTKAAKLRDKNKLEIVPMSSVT